MVCIWDVESGKILYKVRWYPCILLDKCLICAFPYSFQVTKAQSRLLISIPKNLLVRSDFLVILSFAQPSYLVLTGSKDGTMLMGEVEAGLDV